VRVPEIEELCAGDDLDQDVAAKLDYLFAGHRDRKCTLSLTGPSEVLRRRIGITISLPVPWGEAGERVYIAGGIGPGLTSRMPHKD